MTKHTTGTDQEGSASRGAINLPPIVSPKEWETAHAEMLGKEKAFTRIRDVLAAERRRMPWMVVEQA
jgi:predicted dithiol-disulfide oxidoreductase (DUF899 family)